MKKTSKIRLISFALAFILICAAGTFSAFAADNAFESQIAAFPESYRVYLRELHEKYPNWKFEPVFTYLDFNEAVENQLGAKSLVYNSSASDVLKSTDEGDYNKETGQFIYKDGSFVEANRIAVSYYVDPRNFLNEEGIFQFELLSFSESHTKTAIEKVLKGSFMYKTYISYYDSDGVLHETDTKYSTAIYKAGKKYNINPCYLASKIRNEVGDSGSGSVSGKYSGYEGYYNFYNIGATDGAGAIARGLAWAKNGTDYHRPWTTPEKSIYGGAQYLAEKYIAKGQHTGYFQRFNVNPACTYPVYTHQYMTNLTGALSQGYTTYLSYKDMGTLDDEYIFVIPVYENMPCADNGGGSAQMLDSLIQYGTVTATSSRVRTGPSTFNDALTDSSGTSVTVTKGTSVKILEKVKTDTSYYASLLQYPYWYRIEFTSNGILYNGYIPENFVSLTTSTKVGTGEYEIAKILSASFVDMTLHSTDKEIATITDKGTVNFLKAGTVYIVAYDSLGKFDKVKFTVTDSASVTVSGLSVTSLSSNSAKVSFQANENAVSYQIVVTEKDTGKKLLDKTVTSSSYTLTGLSPVTDYNIYVRAVLSADKTYGPYQKVSLTTSLTPVNTVKLLKNYDGKYTVYWDKIDGVTGFEVASFNAEDGTYKVVARTNGTAKNCTLDKKYSSVEFFSVRAYKDTEGGRIYSEYSANIYTGFIPAASVKNITVSNVTDSSYKISWAQSEGYKYRIYKDGTLVKSTGNTSYTVKKLGQSALSKYRISLYTTIDGMVYEGAYSGEFKASTTPKAVTDVKAKATPDGAVLSWAKDENASYYRVYVYNASKKKYVKAAQVTDNTCTITGQMPVSTVKIKVLTYIKTKAGTLKSVATTASFVTAPEVVSSVKIKNNSTSSYTIYWSKAQGADKYRVYRYDSAKKKYVKIGSTSSASFTVSGISPGTANSYKIMSVALSGKKILTYSYSPVYKFSTLPEKVENVTASSVKASSAKLSWDEVKGADYYIIYKLNSKGKYVRTGHTKNTSYEVGSLKSNTSYTFKVKALKKLSGKNYYGSASDKFTVKTPSAK